VAASTNSIVVFICMRIFQAAGSSAVPAIGAGTLAVRTSYLNHTCTYVSTLRSCMASNRIYMLPRKEQL
jgi:hypothetical protein